MSDSLETSRPMVAELRFGPELAGMAQVGSRSIHQYWQLLATHFRDVLLAPQRRFDDAGVAWTWREVAGSRPASAADLVVLRKRLMSCNEAFGENAEKELGKHDSAGVKSRATLSDVRAAMSGMVASLTSKPDAELASFVARTEIGLMLHSWGASVPAKPASPEPHEYEVSGRVIVGTEPVAGYEVVLENRKGLRMSWMISDASGYFGFPAVSRGEYRIRVISDRVPFPEEGTAIKVERGPVTNLQLCSSSSPSMLPEPAPIAPDDIVSSNPVLPPLSTGGLGRYVLIGILALLAILGGRWVWNAKSRSQQSASLAVEGSKRESISPLQPPPLPLSSSRLAASSNAGAETSIPANAGLGSGGLASGNPGGHSAGIAKGSPPTDKSATASVPNDSSASPKGDKAADSLAGKLASSEPGPAEGEASESEFTSKTAGPALGTAGGMSSVLAGAGTGGLPPTATDTPPGASAGIDVDAPPTGSSPAAPPTSGHSDKNKLTKAGPTASSKPTNSAVPTASPASVAATDSSDVPETKAKKDAPDSIPPAPAVTASSAPTNPVESPKKTSSPPGERSSGAIDSPAVKDLAPPQIPTPRPRATRKRLGLNAAPSQAKLDEDSHPPDSAPEELLASPEKSASVPSSPVLKKDVGESSSTSSSDAFASVSTIDRITPEPSPPTKSQEKRRSRATSARKRDGSSQPANDGVDPPLGEESATTAYSGRQELGTSRLFTQISPWKLRLLGDLILPTRPMRMDEEDAVDALRAQLLQERRAQIPPALAHPMTWCGYALELPLALSAPEASLPQWQCLDGLAELEATARPGHAEISWPGEKAMGAATYILSSPDGTELARFVSEKTGACILTAHVTVRSWVWFSVEGTSPDRVSDETPLASRYEWQCLSGAAQTSNWQRNDHWRGGRGSRLDFPPSAPGGQNGVLTLAFVDRLSGWALVRDLSQSSTTLGTDRLLPGSTSNKP